MESAQFIKTVVQEIVTYPDDVEVSKTTDSMGVLLLVKTNPLDSGFLIGKQGATINAIRHLGRIAGYKNREKINIKYDDPRPRPDTNL